GRFPLRSPLFPSTTLFRSLLWTREDDTTHDLYRPPARNALTGAFGADGRLNAVRVQLVAPSVTARWAPAVVADGTIDPFAVESRSEEHTSELQSRENLVCR